jgi:zinc/manganese transport system permease protein
MNLANYLSQAFAQHALLAGGLVALMCGIIGPFVISRGMAFAVHGTSELAFTGAAGGLLLDNDPILGAFIGGIIVATILGTLGNQEKERDSTIGVILAFGLGVGVLLLNFYHGFATQATNILFGDIFGVSNDQLLLLIGVGVVVLIVMAIIFRPLLFASVDPGVAEARGVPVRLLGIVFLYVLALTVTATAQVVGTLLVLSLAITPAAAAQRLATRPLTITMLSILFALTASIGGILASLASGTIKPSVLVTGISFGLYVFARLYGTPAAPNAVVAPPASLIK